MKTSNPLREIINNGKLSTNGVGGVKKRRYEFEDLRSGESTTDIEEINLCLNCPYPKCMVKCDRIRNYKINKKKKGDD